MDVKLIAVVLTCCSGTVGVAQAQTLDQEMPGLADKIGKALAPKGLKNVAAIDFTDLQGQPNELGRYLAERLAVEMVSEEGVSMMDRANIKSILAEHKLTEEGLVNPANAKKLGEFAGVDAILTGNVTALDDGFELIVKAISTASAQIVAAGRIKFPKTSEIQQLFNRSVSGGPGSSGPPTVSTGERGGASYQDSAAIATKDIGSLRIILKSVLPVRFRDNSGRDQVGIRCSFNFISRETQRALTIAANAEGRPQQNFAGYTGFVTVQGIGGLLRSNLNDERGGIWELATSSLKGIGVVGVGSGHSPGDVVSLLAQRDRTNSNGAVTTNAVPASGGFDTMLVPTGTTVPVVFGSTTPILPGNSVGVTMEFVRRPGSNAGGSSAQFFQLESEIVVGVEGTNSQKSYSLQNLTFDRVSMPVF